VAGAMAPARMRKGAQAEGFPALRSGSPCDRHFFSTLLSDAVNFPVPPWFSDFNVS
jgi:hypothetical protein